MKKKNTVKRLLATLLAVIMMASMLPVTALAGELELVGLPEEVVSLQPSTDVLPRPSELITEEASTEPPESTTQTEVPVELPEAPEVTQTEDTVPEQYDDTVLETVEDLVSDTNQPPATTDEAVALIQTHNFTPVVQPWTTNAATTRNAAIATVRGQVETLIQSNGVAVTALTPWPNTLAGLPNPTVGGTAATDRTFRATFNDGGPAVTADFTVSVEFLHGAATGVTATMAMPQPGGPVVAANSSTQFNAAVLPAAIPQGVTWSVAGHEYASINETGLLTVGDVPADTELTVTATRIPTTGDANELYGSLTATVVEELLEWEGEGTVENPFLIADAAGLELLSGRVNAGFTGANVHFLLTADITLDNTWTPIGHGRTVAQRFAGTFDGGNHRINFAHGSAPLFNFPPNNIRNLSIYGPFIAGAGLTVNGDNSLQNANATNIDNVRILSGTTIRESGFLNLMGGGTISNSYIESNVRIGWDAAANDGAGTPFQWPARVGFTGGAASGSFVAAFAGTLENNVSHATVYGQNQVGGIAGVKEYSMRVSIFRDNEFHGEVIATGDMVGGILGAGYNHSSGPNSAGAVLENNLVTGTITGGNRVGGIFGGEAGVTQMWSGGSVGRVIGNTFEGTVTATGGDVVGGIIGYMRSLNRNNIISDNTFTANSGANRVIGGVDIIDTIHPNPTHMPGVTIDYILYFNTQGTAAANPAPAGIGGITRRNYYRTDDPLGADAANLGVMVGGTPIFDNYAEAAVAALNKHDFTPVVQSWITNAATTRTAAIDQVRAQVNALLEGMDVAFEVPAPGTGVAAFPNPPANFGVPPTDRTFTVNVTGEDGSTDSTTIIVSIEFLPILSGEAVESAIETLATHTFTPVVQPWTGAAAGTRTAGLNAIIAQINTAFANANVTGVTAALPAPTNELPTLTAAGLPAEDRTFTVNLTGPAGTFGSTRITVNIEFLRAAHATGVTVPATSPFSGVNTVIAGSTLQFTASVQPAGLSQAINWSIVDLTGEPVDIPGLTISESGLVTIGPDVPLNTAFRVRAATAEEVGTDGNPVINTSAIAGITVVEAATVYVSVEGFTVGHGFYVEPIPVRIPASGATAGRNARLALHLALEAHNAQHNANLAPVGSVGMLDRIAGLPPGPATPPPFMMEVLAGTRFDPYSWNPGGLGSFCFGNPVASGWLFAVNHREPPVGANSLAVNNGDTIRWMFTLLMNDTGIPGGMGGPSFFIHADKSALTRALFASENQPVAPDVRQFALDVIINQLASEAMVEAAIAWIVDGVAPDMAPRPDSIVLNRGPWNNAVRGQSQTFTARVVDQFGNNYANQDVIWTLEPVAHPNQPTSGASHGATQAIHPETTYSTGVVTLHAGQYGGSMTLRATSVADPDIDFTVSIAVARPVISLTAANQPALTTTVDAGDITGTLTVAPTVTLNAPLSFQWYSNTTLSNTGGTPIEAATEATFPIPADLTPGAHFFYVVIRSTLGAAPLTSRAVTVFVAVDIYALNDLIAEAIERNEDDYTPVTWVVFEQARGEAMQVEADATPQQITDAFITLFEAMNALVEIADIAEIIKATENVLERLQRILPAPEFGNEWVIFALARGGHDDRDFFDHYLSNVLRHVGENADDQGRLEYSRPTENARLVIALNAIGFDATNVNGVDLVAPLFDVDWVTAQGLNAITFALIALDSGGYSNQTIVDKLIENILARQEDGGYWNPLGWYPDFDSTAQALQALAPHRAQNTDVNNAITDALDWLSRNQSDTGGWGFMGSESAETISQVIVALTALGIDPRTDTRFSEEENNPITALLRFQDPATGGFMSRANLVDPMTTWQAAYALVAHDRFMNNQNSLHDMSDAVQLFSDGVEPAPVNKNALIAAIAAAEARNQSNYMPLTWNAMQIQLTQARYVRDNLDATQTQVNSAVESLNDAIARLVPIAPVPVTPTMPAPITPTVPIPVTSTAPVQVTPTEVVPVTPTATTTPVGTGVGDGLIVSLDAVAYTAVGDDENDELDDEALDSDAVEADAYDVAALDDEYETAEHTYEEDATSQPEAIIEETEMPLAELPEYLGRSGFPFVWIIVGLTVSAAGTATVVIIRGHKLGVRKTKP